MGVTVYRSTHDYQSVGLDQVNAAAGGNVQGLAGLIFTDYLFAFELTSALLITAAVGAMVLAHVERGPIKTQKERALERFASDAPYPLVGPGVFATSHSVATPALLPDGQIANESQAPGIEMQRLARGHLAGRGHISGVQPTASTPATTEGEGA